MSQEDPVDQNIEIQSESTSTEEGDATLYIDQLNNFKKNPINLNHTSAEELKELQLLTDIQINNLLSHIQKNGKLITIYELQTIQGFDLNLIMKILPYVRVADNFNSSNFSLKEMFKEGTHEILGRIQRVTEHQAGYFKPDSITKADKPNSYYLGDANHVFTRYRFRYGTNVSWGVLGDKDAGEQFGKGAQKSGFDFYSAHILIRNVKFVKALAIGDYQATFGQGLVMWNGFAFGKSANIAGVKRNAMGLKAYNSTSEARFMRGAALSLKLGKHIEATGFYSRLRVDANATKADTVDATANLVDVTEISALQTFGLHNTNSLNSDRKNIVQQIVGGNVAYNIPRFHLGATVSHYSLSAPLVKSFKPYNQFDFSGKENLNAGVDFNYVVQNMNWFGEYAMSQNGGKAFIGGLVMMLDPKITVTTMYRNFSKDYQNLTASVVSENTLPQNENGLYVGVEAKFARYFTAIAFLDQFKFPWIKYQINAPSSGTDLFGQLNFTPNKKTDVYFRYRARAKDVANTADNNGFPAQQFQQNIRFNIAFQPMAGVTLKSRVEYVILNKPNNPKENGMMIYQDVSFKKIGTPVKITARYGLFQTDGYNSRIYTYENDVLYAFSVPALYDKGSRAYLIAEWDITRKMELAGRVGRTFYSNKQIQSQGSLNEINGPTKTEIKIQVRLKL